jgi:hypothetical protein
VTFIALFATFLLVVMAITRKKRNRYRKHGLPPPSPLCSRGFDYK